MAINKKLIHFRSKSVFDEKLANNEILDTSIVFIQDSQQIWTHGQLYNCSEMVPITYGELKLLRDNGVLIPGMQYRITDYVTTTSQSYAYQSAQHLFDVIVTADSENTLNKKARAIQHEGDTYFADSNLSAWELWYCLDNDTNRFSWADTTNGKGVIYRMIDEWNNDCPYDFKNIQTEHPESRQYPGYYYTFSTVIDDVVTDHSILQGKCYNNVMGKFISSNKQELNNNVFLHTSETHSCYNNSFGDNCYYNSFLNNCTDNSFGSGCIFNFFGDDCIYNSFGNTCYQNSFGNNCNYNSFGDGCYNNSFGGYCEYNSFGKHCRSSYFGDACRYNSFGDYCEHNSFGYACALNSFGSGCSENSFGDQCNYNSFETGCYYNSFRVSASKSSSLKGYVQYNHFDGGCSYNIIWNSDTTSSNILLKNINVNKGINGTYGSHNMINIDVLNQDYAIQVAKNSSGEIKTYCEADLIA